VAFDFIALLVVVLLIVAKQLIGGDIQGWAIGSLLSAMVISAIAFWGLFIFTPTIIKWLRQRLSIDLDGDHWQAKLLRLMQDFSDSLTLVRHSGKTITVLSLSVVIRLLKYFSFYLLFMSVAGPSFNSLASLPTEQIVGALIGGEIGASLPVPTFMSFGAYEAGGTLVFQLLGVADKAGAVISLLGVHIWSQAVEYIIGIILLCVFVLLTRRNKRLDNQKVSKGFAWLSWSAAGLVFVAGSFWLALELRAAKKMGSITPPEVGVSTLSDNAEWLVRSQSELQSLNGFVVWSSNRNGNHDILKLSLPEMTISNLTQHPHAEYYPRVSPDGTRMVFSRSQQPWVSQRNTVAWDLYLLDLNTLQETPIATQATFGNWVSNDEITFLKNATSVVKVNLQTMARESLYNSGVDNSMPAGAKIVTPEYNSVNDQLVFSGKQSQIGLKTGFWGTAIMINKQHQGIHDGCQIAWASDGMSMYQVANGGRQGNQFMNIDPSTYELTPMLDLSGEFSHEYFPKDSSNGEYLVFAASRGDHEHDQADYELFLWKKGSNPEKATRLTFHTGNDNWPDVHIEDK